MSAFIPCDFHGINCFIKHHTLPIIYIGFNNGKVGIYNVTPTGISHVHTMKVAHKSWVKTLALSPDGTKLASGSIDRYFHIYDLTDNNCIKRVKGTVGCITKIIWDYTQTFSILDQLLYSSKASFRIAFSGKRGGVTVYNLINDVSVTTFNKASNYVNDMVPHPTSNWFVISHGTNKLTIWDWNTGKPIIPLQNQPLFSRRIYNVKCNADYILANDLNNVNFLLWDWSGKLIKTIPAIFIGPYTYFPKKIKTKFYFSKDLTGLITDHHSELDSFMFDSSYKYIFTVKNVKTISSIGKPQLISLPDDFAVVGYKLCEFGMFIL